MSCNANKTCKRRRIGTTKRTTRQTTIVYGEPNCIDLTTEYEENIVVDLTIVNDTPPVNLNHRSTVRAKRSRTTKQVTTTTTTTTKTTTASNQPLAVCVLDDLEQADSIGLPEVDYGQYSSNNTPKFQQQSAGESSSSSNSTISCPICLDSDQEILKSSRHLMSTTCGHIFCNTCISATIQSKKCCPTCRKRLTLRGIHQIFL